MKRQSLVPDNVDDMAGKSGGVIFEVRIFADPQGI
jgi:hypothetical protein